MWRLGTTEEVTPERQNVLKPKCVTSPESSRKADDMHSCEYQFVERMIVQFSEKEPLSSSKNK